MIIYLIIRRLNNVIYLRITIVSTPMSCLPFNQQFHLIGRVVPLVWDCIVCGYFLTFCSHSFVVAAVIIREHGGNIGVTSSGIPGEGSIFSIELRTTDSSTEPSLLTPQPVQSPIESGETKLHDRQRHSAKVSPKIEVESSNHQYRRALIVDDSHVVRKMLAKSITNQFLFIEHANDGVEAVNIVKRLMNEGETINVIFLDSFMPNMGGIEACKYIRTLGYVGLIIAISGNVIQEDINEFLAAGADHFIGKPFKLEQLQAVLSGIWYIIISLIIF